MHGGAIGVGLELASAVVEPESPAIRVPVLCRCDYWRALTVVRVKTTWTVTGPVLKDGKLVKVAVIRGSVTGDRLDVALANLQKDIAVLAKTSGTKVSDYVIDLVKEADTKVYEKMEPEPSAKDGGP